MEVWSKKLLFHIPVCSGLFLLRARKGQKMTRHMRVKQVSSYLGVATSTIWSWCKAGNFPSPLKLSPKATVWDKDEIDKFIASKRV